jgi:hypothetical protein
MGSRPHYPGVEYRVMVESMGKLSMGSRSRGCCVKLIKHLRGINGSIDICPTVDKA